MEDEAASSLPKAAKTNSPGRLETSDTRGTEIRGEDASAPEARVAVNAAPKPNAVVVNAKQKGNPLLRYITNVPWEYGEIVPDYVTGRGTCVLFLSLRYHRLNPDYIHDRLKLLGKSYDLRVLLVQVDLAEPQHALKHLTRICILADLTLMLAWNAEEAGKIIETYKIYENKPPEMIMERSDASPHQKITNALTTVRSVNKTDAMTLLTTFGSVKGIVKASSDALSLCPGFGTHKAIRLRKTLHEPFLRNTTRKTPRQSAEVEKPK